MALLNLFKSMRIFNKFRGTRGFVMIYERLLRFRYMITPHTEERVRILAFWEKHGLAATQEAFHVSRRTLFRWQALLQGGGGQLKSLTPRSTAPHTKRKRILPSGLEAVLIKLRTEHPRLGKDKLSVLVAAQGYRISPSTIGRALSDLKEQGKITNPRQMHFNAQTGHITVKTRKRKKKQRRPKGYRVLELDTIVRFVDGVKRYTLTAIDTETRVAFAGCYSNHGAQAATDFLMKVRAVLPDCPEAIQTDNGSEFAAHFQDHVQRASLTHFHTYPRTPKMNAHVERFNRTLEEEFLRWHKPLMRDDIALFNTKLIDWLLWYNTERPHSALGQKAPLQVMMEKVNPKECQKWWTSTNT